MPRPFISAKDAVALHDAAVFLDSRAEPEASQVFASGHVRGAFRVDLEADLSELGHPARGGRHPLPSMERWLALVARWAIVPSTPVVIYDASGGAMAAARAWWMLRAIGHESTFVVDGGWQALRAAGCPIEQGDGREAVQSAEPYPSTVTHWPVVDASFVERVRHDPSWRLIDARAPERYRGDVEPLDPVAGHIPGARNLYWRSQVDPEGMVQPRASLAARFEPILEGVSSDHVVCYCGSGVTACHLLLTMEACGLGGATLYVGSWSEWCRQNRPRACGG